ncbi:MAG: hypothetical protein ACRD3N_03675 [Terracidiphilus sp.]
MEPALRPMSLGEILDRTAQLYRENFVLFAGIFVAYSSVALLLGLLMVAFNQLVRAEHAVTLFGLKLTALGLESLILAMVAGAAVAATSRAVAWVHLGEKATIRGAYSSILPRIGRYLWLMTITFCVVYLPMMLIYFGYLGAVLHFGRGIRANVHAAAGHTAVNPHMAIVLVVVSVIFFLLIVPALVYAVLMGLRYALSLPACVLEDLKAWPAIKRGIALSQGARGRIFVLGLLIFAIKFVVVMTSQAFIVVAAFRHRGQVGAGLQAISAVIGFFTNTFLGPIYATGITLFYYDQRIRKEGYDIEWMMAAAGLTPPAPAAAPSDPPQAGELPQPSEPTRPEFGENL